MAQTQSDYGLAVHVTDSVLGTTLDDAPRCEGGYFACSREVFDHRFACSAVTGDERQVHDKWQQGRQRGANFAERCSRT